jgi:hypothetical protein
MGIADPITPPSQDYQKRLGPMPNIAISAANAPSPQRSTAATSGVAESIRSHPEAGEKITKNTPMLMPLTQQPTVDFTVLLRWTTVKAP